MRSDVKAGVRRLNYIEAFQSTLPHEERQYPLKILVSQELAARFARTPFFGGQNYPIFKYISPQTLDTPAPRTGYRKNYKNQSNNPSYQPEKLQKNVPTPLWELGVRGKYLMYG
jgi:hypothetical protein